MNNYLKGVISLFIKLYGRIYTYRVNQWIVRKIDGLYSMWVSQALGSVGVHTRFSRPLLLQGGGQRSIKIGTYTSVGHHCVLGCWQKYCSGEDVTYYKPEIIIGNHCSIGEYCHITAINKITIGDGLLTGRFVYIGDNAHGSLSWEESIIPPVKRKLLSKGEIIIGQNVWIGDKVTILGGVTIGDNAIIGAGSVVNCNVPSNSMVAGVPAKLVKQV